MTTKTARLEKLEQQKAAIEAKLKREQKKIRDQERKRDTRRKIVAGAIALAHCEKDENFRRQFLSLLERFTEDKDRELFDLPPRPSSGQNAAPAAPGQDESDMKRSFMDRIIKQ